MFRHYRTCIIAYPYRMEAAKYPKRMCSHSIVTQNEYVASRNEAFDEHSINNQHFVGQNMTHTHRITLYNDSIKIKDIRIHAGI